ncbi:MAG TPA: hypothetical protein ENN05_01580 [Deltaproteobacteria bacterium]|nr:hypothetical protein [Deltaproteobacteria bacterium]
MLDSYAIMKRQWIKTTLFSFVGIGACVLIYYMVSGTHQATVSRPGSDGMAIGMNLSAVSYWTRELPFVDVAKCSMEWVTQNHHQVQGGKNSWHTDMLDSIPLDHDGYPIFLPVEVQGAEAPQIVASLMLRTVYPHYPAGRYVCLYDGQGEIRFGFDAKMISAEPGRIELDVTPSPGGNGILMKIMRSEKGDHIRNIRVIMPGFETTCETKPFNPVFLERLRPFKVIRFMDWQKTNDSGMKNWSQRTKLSSYTQASVSGVAIEYMVDLCNELGADPWFCMPHQADSDYIRRFAQLVKERLAPDRKVYLEYSNEVWNAMFKQYHWVKENGESGLSHPEKYAQFAGQAFNIWQMTFGDQTGRVIRVVSGQQVSPRIIQGAIDYLGPDGMDAIATSAYFGLGKDDYEELRILGPRATATDVMRLVMGNIETESIATIKKHSRIASKYNVDLLAYEAGPSICSSPLGSSPPYLQALWDSQRSSDLYRVYRGFLGSCKEMEIKLFMAYSYVTAQETKYGSWGHLEYLDQPVTEALKYRALLDEMDIPYIREK